MADEIPVDEEEVISSTPNVTTQPHRRHSHLYSTELTTDQCPIVYAPEYNISFCGVEKCHPFDAKKWGRIFRMLTESGQLSPGAVVRSKQMSKEDLQIVHTKQYLRSLCSNITLASILEVFLVVCFPHFLVDRRVLRPMRFQTGGSILAARLALQHGWAINLGGGFHHASADKGGGFCVYADITLSIRILLDDGLINKAMIVDLDAHQGNGHGRDFTNDKERVYIMDFYNSQIYPSDHEAKLGISRPVTLVSGTGDDVYLPRLALELQAAFAEFSPDLLVFVAGTDSLRGDPLGELDLTAQGIIRRDQQVFEAARQHKVPIVMFTSGGYQRQTARVIADSILNLHSAGLIELR